MMPKPPAKFCIDSFVYKEYVGENNWSEPIYADPVLIERCRIDRGAAYTSTMSGKQLLYNAVVFCYEGMTGNIAHMVDDYRVLFARHDP